MAIRQEIRLYADYYQFYVQDSAAFGSTDDPTFWTEEASDDRPAIGEGLLGVGCAQLSCISAIRTVPIVDRMVLRAVGVTWKGANRSYRALRTYLPFAWELADYYADRAMVGHQESALRLIDMALWLTRGRD